MQSAGNTYLHQKAVEGIEGRRHPSHMYKTYTRTVATANSFQRNDARLYAQDSLPPLRKSELTDRIAAQQSFADQRIRPLPAAGAISLHPLETTSASPLPAKLEDEDVFFDDAPYRQSKYILLNGEVYRSERPMEQDRTLYGIDSPTAAIRAAVKDAMRRSTSTKAPPSDDSDVSDDSRAQIQPNQSRSRLGKLPEKQEMSEGFGEGSYREFVSSSGRTYRVVEVIKGGSRRVAGESNVRNSLRDAQDAMHRAKEGESQSRVLSRHSSARSRHQRRSRSNGHDSADRAEDQTRTKRNVAPQRPVQPRDRRQRTSHYVQNKHHRRHRSTSPRDAEACEHRSRKSDYASSSERLPPIVQERQSRRRSPSPQQRQGAAATRDRSQSGNVKERSAERRGRRVDSADSQRDVSLSRSRSPRDNEYSPAVNNQDSRKESDCVVTGGSVRPVHRPRKRREDGKAQRSGERGVSTSVASSQSDAADNRRRATSRQRRVEEDDCESDWSNASDASSWSVISSDLPSYSSSELSRWSASSSTLRKEERKKSKRHGRDRRQRHERGNRRLHASSSVTSSISIYSENGDHEEETEKRRRRKAAGREKPSGKDQEGKDKIAPQPSRSSSPQLRSQSASTSVPTPPRPGSGVKQPHQSRPMSPPRPPVVHAVMPPLPTGLLPPFTEEMIPSNRYEPACPSPVAHPAPPPPPPLSGMTAADEGQNVENAGDAAGCVSPALGQPRGDDDSAASTPNPMRRGYNEIPSEPLQLTHFNDLRQPSFASSGPVCSPSQGALSLLPRDAISASGLHGGAPLDLDFITEHVLRVIRDRLGGGDGGVHGSAPDQQHQHQHQRHLVQAVEAARARSKAEQAAEEERLEAEKAAEAERKRADLLQLRKLLRDAQAEIRHLRDANVPLDNLTSSLQFAFAQVTRFGDDELARLELDEATASHTLPANVAADSGTLIYADGERKLPNVTEEETLAKLTNLEVGAGTLERLLHDLRERRSRHEEEQRQLEATRRAVEEKRRQDAAEAAERQRRAAEEEAAAAAAAARALREQQERDQERQRRVAALLAEETSGRTAIRAEEKSAHDGLVVEAARSAEESHRRAAAAQAEQFELERTDLCEEELDVRADIAAMEATEAEDFWDVAAQLWQAAADEAEAEAEAEAERQAAEEAGRRKSAAWQAAQAEEAARLQAELKRMDDAAAQRRASATSSANQAQRNLSRFQSKGKLVRSNLIPGQILDVSEGDGKIRLVGDPHVAAVEARLRERRRADRLRQERLASAMGRPPSTKAGRGNMPGNRRFSAREPSTVRINVVGSGVAPAAKKTGQPASRASSRRSVSSSRSHNSGGGSGRLSTANRSGDVPPARSRLHSQSNFVEDGDLDLGVEGQRVGTPQKTRSRASSLASAGVPHMGGIFNAATPHKNRFPDDETDALTSSSALVDVE